MLRRLAKLAGAVDLRDLLAIAGLGFASYGAGELSAPAGWIVLGAGVFYLGVFHRLVVGSRLPPIVVPAPESTVTTSERL